MASILRRPGQLARLSRSSLDYLSRSSRQPIYRGSLPRPLYASRYQRFYSTEPPKEPKDQKEKSISESKPQPDGKDLKGEGKSLPDQDGLPKSDASKEAGSEDGMTKAKSEDFAKLTKDEIEALDQMCAFLLQGMPRKQADLTRHAFEDIKKNGIPREMREIMDRMKDGQRPDLATAAKLVRMVTKMARQTADKTVRANFNDETGPAKQKSGVHDPGADAGKEGKEEKKGRQEQNGGPRMFNSEIKIDMNTVMVSAFVAYLLYRTLHPGEASREITWQEFRKNFLDRGLVEKLTVVNNSRVRVHLHREAVAAQYPDSPAQHTNFFYYFSIGSVEAFERQMDRAQDELQIPSSERIPTSYSEEGSWTNLFFSLAPTLLLIGGIWALSRRATGGGGGGTSGIFGMGRSRAKKFNHETDVKVKFSDVAGMDEAKQEIMEFVSFLKEPGMYSKLGAKIPRGAILSGPPGTGKTLLAKATAGESQVPFFSVSGSEFVEMFVGVGASRVRDLFATARKSTPCIIFIDEIDAIGKSRSKNNFGGGHEERESTLNQILTEMDGFNTTEQVVVLAGTNRPDVLDKALMRPGRFDRHISIDRPTMEGRKQIFGVHLKRIVTKEDMNYLEGRLASLTPGFSGADIANCVNEAALIAARGHAESVTMSHFEQAIERVVGGLEKKSLVLSPEEKRTVAYHEAGHAICGWYFRYADPLLKVSIIPRGQGALGYAQYLPAGDTYLMTVNQLMDRMAMTLAGRISEELHFDSVSTGASDDFNKVTRMATAMVTKWGMSNKIGYIYFEDDSQQQLHKPFSEETAKNIDMEVRRIVDEAYKQCKDLLIEKKKEVGIVAEELLKKEVLTRDDLIRLLGKRPFEEKEEFAKYFGRDNVPNAEKEAPAPDAPTKEDMGSPPPAAPTPTAFKDLR